MWRLFLDLINMDGLSKKIFKPRSEEQELALQRSGVEVTGNIKFLK